MIIIIGFVGTIIQYAFTHVGLSNMLKYILFGFIGFLGSSQTTAQQKMQCQQLWADHQQQACSLRACNSQCLGLCTRQEHHPGILYNNLSRILWYAYNIPCIHTCIVIICSLITVLLKCCMYCCVRMKELRDVCIP